ncbi:MULTISPECIES: hypothetical protein [Amycolatopsis]|uniref:hypothetical protein n=1 Tax=Amycolatopsis TaxID=1813 RepID=UPI001E517219|nr:MULTISPECIES: hypothetical protein [Amycolatopsis]
MSLVLTLSWVADTEATGIRDAHIGTIPGYRNRGLASAGIAAGRRRERVRPSQPHR